LETPDQNSFFIDDWWISPSEGLLKKGDYLVHLEPKVMEVLVYLAARQGEVVMREEIERDVWHGAMVGYDAITSTIIKLRKAFNDNARKPGIIATIPKRGYQLIAPVRHSQGSDEIAQNEPDKPQSRLKNAWLGYFLLMISLTLGVAILWYKLQVVNEKIEPHQSNVVQNSIAILPFENLGSDPKQDYLAVGITEDVITDLSHLSNMLVIASNASNTYKGMQVQPQVVGEELNVDFILRGNIRQIGDLIRINVQLIDTRTGFNKWGQSYDRKVTDVFAIQRELTSSIISYFDLRLTSKEKKRLAHNPTNSLIAYDYFQEGQRLSRNQTKEASEEARRSYRKAIESDPNYGRPYGALAYSLAYAFRRGWTDAPLETLDQALVLARKGVDLDNTVPQTHWSLGYVYLMRQEFDKAEKAASQALIVAPSYADGYGLLALISNNNNQPQKAIEYITKGMRLNPYYTWDYLYNLGRAYYSTGRYIEAIDTLEKARDRNENAMPVRLFLAASYVRAGRQDDAEWEVEQIEILNPSETVTHTKQSIPILNTELMESFLADLRQAGLAQ